MSEDDYSEESYEFEFEDEEESVHDFNDSSASEQLQNQYYTAKAFKDDNKSLAIEKLTDISQHEVDDDSALWIFKSNKQIAKIYFQNHQFDKSLQTLHKLIDLIPKLDDKNYLEESLNKMFNNYSLIKDNEFVLSLTNIILHIIGILGKSNNNDRLWIKVNLCRFSILLLDRNNLAECNELIQNLNTKLDEVSEITRDSYTLEIIASEIELLSLQEDVHLNRLNYLYRKSLSIASPVAHPRILGIIKQCGGKIEFFQGNYDMSRLNFYESFKQFDESGSDEKDTVFKYLILLSVITENEFNPFESQETQHYTQESEFQKLLLLIDIFQDLDLNSFKNFVVDISNVEEFQTNIIFKQSLVIIGDLIIDKILINFFKAYSVLRFEFLINYLNLNEADILCKIFRLNNGGKITNIKIDFINKIIECSNNPLSLDNIKPESVLTNMKCLDAINFIDNKNSETDDMNVDSSNHTKKSKSNDAIIKELLFMNVKPHSDRTYVVFINNWLSSLRTSFPKLQKLELSTKDQIFTEQKAEKSNVEDVFNTKHKSIETTNDGEFKKIETLKVWANELLNYNYECV